MSAVRLREVLPRDGFQDLGSPLPTPTKIAAVQAIWNAGLRWVEVTSMVHPRWVPQFVDAEEVLAAVRELEGLEASVFVPNRRGLERALGVGVDEVSLAVASTDELSRENFAMDRRAALAEVEAVAAAAADAGVRVSVTIGGAFGCPFTGPVADETVAELAAALAAGPVSSILVADTIGVATSADVGRLVARVRDAVDERPLGVHLHGGASAVAGVRAGVAAGATIVDASLAGFGGCPFVPHAPGNVPTELVVAALEADGVQTGLEPEAVARAAADARRLVDGVAANA